MKVQNRAVTLTPSADIIVSEPSVLIRKLGSLTDAWILRLCYVLTKSQNAATVIAVYNRVFEIN